MPSSATQEWLDKALEDEVVVGLISSAGRPWSKAAYHLQHTAEKYIKAALVESGVAPPKTHDLQQLLILFPGGPVPTAVDRSAAMISSYAWLTRYPGAPPIDEQDVGKAQMELESIRNWALSVIP